MSKAKRLLEMFFNEDESTILFNLEKNKIQKYKDIKTKVKKTFKSVKDLEDAIKTTIHSKKIGEYYFMLDQNKDFNPICYLKLDKSGYFSFKIYTLHTEMDKYDDEYEIYDSEWSIGSKYPSDIFDQNMRFALLGTN